MHCLLYEDSWEKFSSGPSAVKGWMINKQKYIFMSYINFHLCLAGVCVCVCLVQVCLHLVALCVCVCTSFSKFLKWSQRQESHRKGTPIHPLRFVLLNVFEVVETLASGSSDHFVL